MIRPLGYCGGVHVRLTAVSLILGIDSVTYTPAICIGSVNIETGDDATIVKMVYQSSKNWLQTYYLVQSFL